MKKATGHFYATQRGLWAGRYYKVYVDENGLHGAYLGSDDPEFSLATAQVTGDEGKALLAKRAIKKSRAREVEYDQLEPGGAEFLQKDKRNFSFRPGQWSRLTPRPNPQPKSFPNRYGVLDVELSNGQKHTFGLVGKGELASVVNLLTQWLPADVPVPITASSTPDQLRADQEQAANGDALCWAITWALTIIGAIRVYLQTRSALCLAALLVTPLIYKWVRIVYLAFFMSRDTAAQLRANRSQKPPQ